MKKHLLFAAFSLLTMAAMAQNTYKGLPVIKATERKVDYRVENIWSRGDWGIAPEISPDVLAIPCFSRTVQFAFYTDIDSIAFPMNSAKVQQFYVLTADNKYALTEIRGFDYKPISFDMAAVKSPRYRFWYEQDKNNEYLARFRSLYPVESLVKGLNSDSAKALRILKWVHDQWKHNGDNEPRKNDAISILEEVKEGKNFRCVEYGIVTTTALNAIGLPARVLALKTKDVETTRSGAGHVLLEVYLRDMGKWVMMDGQFDAMPVLNGIPLNAVEFQQAIVNNYDQLRIRSLSNTDKDKYIMWAYPYLYYFDVSFDNREGIGRKKEMQEGKPSLMLVPIGAKNPSIFQQQWPISNVVYTSSVNEFYAKPE
ncbi:MAG TPA: transglutaminase-like domain-containing protein [Flavisolibacter sp.]|jgi:hypothetical protein